MVEVKVSFRRCKLQYLVASVSDNQLTGTCIARLLPEPSLEVEYIEASAADAELFVLFIALPKRLESCLVGYAQQNFGIG